MNPLSDQADMADLFDFNAASTCPQEYDSFIETMGIDSEPGALALEAPNAPIELCATQDIVSSLGPIDPAVVADQDKEFDTNFSNWIPRYSKPEQACDYCCSRQLECFKVYEGQSSCSPCRALFRPCSFSKPDSEGSRPKNALDTLHVVTEDVINHEGQLTGIKPLRSKSFKDELDRNAKKNGARFSKESLKILKTWMNEHRENPYPSEEEKKMLQEKTGLSNSQVSNWMANTRRREKTRIPRVDSSPNERASCAMNIPGDRSWDLLSPFERWKNSPPEHDPAPLTAIVDAAEQYNPPESSHSSVVNSTTGKPYDSVSSDCFSQRRAPSTNSFETGQSRSAFSSGSRGSAPGSGRGTGRGSGPWSNGSAESVRSFGSFGSRGSLGSFGNNTKKDRRRRRRQLPLKKADPVKDNRPFQCTFCTDRFKSKYDWSRHEKTLHISLEKWICSPVGKEITSETGQKICAFCGEFDPSPEHFEFHNVSACEEKGIESRTFYRKDHLRQHLRLVHNGCKMTGQMDLWKSEYIFINSRCGFCEEKFTKWQDRVDHLAQEFRSGAQMKNWRGCRGLDPDVAQQVTNAMPPYLIGNEAMAPVPFSASNDATMLLHQFWADSEFVSQGTDKSGALPTQPPVSPAAATCWEIMTLRLGQFVRSQIDQGLPVTEDKIQSEARHIQFGEDDGWNQTIADNPEWMMMFKKAHGLCPTHDRYSADLDDLGAYAYQAVMSSQNSGSSNITSSQAQNFVNNTINHNLVEATENAAYLKHLAWGSAQQLNFNDQIVPAPPTTAANTGINLQFPTNTVPMNFDDATVSQSPASDQLVGFANTLSLTDDMPFVIDDMDMDLDSLAIDGSF